MNINDTESDTNQIRFSYNIISGQNIEYYKLHITIYDTYQLEKYEKDDIPVVAVDVFTLLVHFQFQLATKQFERKWTHLDTNYWQALHQK